MSPLPPSLCSIANGLDFSLVTISLEQLPVLGKLTSVWPRLIEYDKCYALEKSFFLCMYHNDNNNNIRKHEISLVWMYK